MDTQMRKTTLYVRQPTSAPGILTTPERKRFAGAFLAAVLLILGLFNFKRSRIEPGDT